MHPKLLSLFNRLEVLPPRERLLTLVGAPLLLVLLAEAVVFDPARRQTAEARTQVERQQAELQSLRGVLQAMPAVAQAPASDELQRQRDALQTDVDAARALLQRLDQRVDWGTVLRGTAANQGSVRLAQLRTLPAEQVMRPLTGAEIGRAHV